MRKLSFFFVILLMVFSKDGLSQGVIISRKSSPLPMFGQSIKDTKSEISGTYYGASTQGKEKIAWLLRLDLTKNIGMIYTPIRSLKIINLNHFKETQISFQSEVDAGIVIKFLGTIDQHGIKGVFTTYRELLGRLEYISKNEATLQMIRSKTDSGCGTTQLYCGKYSNVKYNEESGDLNGEELIIIPSLAETYHVVFTSYLEGGMPMVVDELRVQENKIAFIVKRTEGVFRYAGSLRNSRLILYETTPWGKASKRQITLKATSSLDRLLALPQGKK